MTNPFKRFHQLPITQKTSLAVVAFIALTIPVGLYTVLNPVRVRSEAAATTLVATITTPNNAAPLLETTAFPEGSINHSYSFTVQGFDPDHQDTLNISAFGLPPGFKVTNCQAYAASTHPNALSCLITGTPLKTGSYHVYLTIRDDRNASTQLRASLTIK